MTESPRRGNEELLLLPYFTDLQELERREGADGLVVL